MKKVLFAVLAVLCVASVSFAEVGTTMEKPAAKAYGAAKTHALTGKVKSVTKTSIDVVNAMGKEITVNVTPGTTLSDKDGKQTSLDKIAAGANVNVQFKATATGVEATAVKIVG